MSTNLTEDIDPNSNSLLLKIRETTIRDEFEHDVQDVYKERQEVQFDKMSKLIADLDSDNHRLRKEFELYKEV